jgi:hypothetical protein
VLLGKQPLSWRTFSHFPEPVKSSARPYILYDYDLPCRFVRFQVLTAASMKFRFVFWDVLRCKTIVDNYFTRQYIPEDKPEISYRFAPYEFQTKITLFSPLSHACYMFRRIHLNYFAITLTKSTVITSWW